MAGADGISDRDARENRAVLLKGGTDEDPSLNAGPSGTEFEFSYDTFMETVGPRDEEPGPFSFGESSASMGGAVVKLILPSDCEEPVEVQTAA